jgi:ATP-dependent Clp protease ATP-binding subunit ClpC
MLIGSEYQAVESDLRTLKSNIKEYLQKQYKKFDRYPEANFEQYKLRMFEVKIRPTYKSADKSFPSSFVLKVPVAAIYGQTDEHYYECFLPTLGIQFVYHDPKLLTTLVNSFATNHLTQLDPSAIVAQINLPEPKIDEISLRINENRDYSFSNNWDNDDNYRMLSTLAEQFPYSKAVQRNLAVFPDVAWEMEADVELLIEKITVSSANVLVVGKSGVGKSAVLRQAIKKLSAKKKNSNNTFWQLLTQRITANARYLGEWQENVEILIQELSMASGILWVVDVTQLLQSGGDGAQDSIAAFMIPYLQENKLQIVGEVTPTQLESMRRLLPGFVENFQIVQIEELQERKIYTILEKFADYATQNLKIPITTQATETAYRLLNRYYPYESFPGKAIKFLSQCINYAQNHKTTIINPEVVYQNFVQQTGMPELFLRDDLRLDNSELQQFFNSRIIGQEAAVHTLCNVVKIFKTGLNNPYKPISTLLLAGPTGVGKTAATKALAEYFFGKGQKRSPLVRIDMSEFQHAGHLARFIGAGGEVGKLVQEIRERPFAVVLLDEIEKADPAIFDALLTVLDEGKLVDAYGRSTNFCNTIIIMTSNLGASNRTAIGFGGGAAPNYEAAISQFFRPEFVNRIDHIVPFVPLSTDNILHITKKELDELHLREGIDKRHLKLQFTQILQQHIASIGFDERYGARPLQRAVEQIVTAPFAKWLLDNPDCHHQNILLDWQDSKLIISLLSRK